MKIEKPYRIPENAINALLARPTLGQIYAGAANFLKDTLQAELSYLGVSVLIGGPHEGRVLYNLIEGDKIYFGATPTNDRIANDNRANNNQAA